MQLIGSIKIKDIQNCLEFFKPVVMLTAMVGEQIDVARLLFRSNLLMRVS